MPEHTDKMARDLVFSLRNPMCYSWFGPKGLFEKAAEEIERLRKALQEAKKKTDG